VDLSQRCGRPRIDPAIATRPPILGAESNNSVVIT
jgi:hypothetical protein